MQDTTKEMLEKQREIFLSKTSTQRFIIADDLINFGRLMLENSIKQKKPEISETELKIKVFKRYYENTFNIKEFEKIVIAMEKYCVEHHS